MAKRELVNCETTIFLVVFWIFKRTAIFFIILAVTTRGHKIFGIYQLAEVARDRKKRLFIIFLDSFINVFPCKNQPNVLRNKEKKVIQKL